MTQNLTTPSGALSLQLQEAGPVEHQIPIVTTSNLLQFANLQVVPYYALFLDPVRLAEEPSSSALVDERLDYLLSRLDEISRLTKNWDSYASESPTRKAIGISKELLRDLDSIGAIYLPRYVFPLSGGGVQMEWEGLGKFLEIEVSSMGTFSYLFGKGFGASRTFDENNDVAKEKIIDLVAAVVC